MANRVSAEQVAEIKQVLTQDAGSIESASAIAEVLQIAKISTFTPEETDRMGLAASMLGGGTVRNVPHWSANSKRGLFFVFEGLDRSGKSTQSKLLAKCLEEEGKRVAWRCFPDRSTPIGMLIDLYLQRAIDLPDRAVHELFSANRWESMQSINQELESGTYIVCDRYAFSGVAYSASKGLDFTWCQTPDCGILSPDCIFYLHVSEQVGASRSNFGDERYENVDMQTRVRQEFQRPALREGIEWRDVNGARPIEEVHAEILATVRAIQDNSPQPVPKLWSRLEDTSIGATDATPTIKRTTAATTAPQTTDKRTKVQTGEDTHAPAPESAPALVEN
eukprot:CAMPEP_0172715860 /NCGR_PEP_ID=MMETSP1074-20121228/67786_1 /TAXON_ID=2916 /ORGANISM="Ceratium fusus, Strain PA161109" /LENGTH=334 /DNA_ID=CAMNT_0013540481 /DNA_START=64 /DNA_END=1068 /DNA_ORIENTATION=+